MSFALEARNAYSRVGLETAVESADPHGLVALMYDGVRAALAAARGHMARGEIARKCEAIGKAIAILEEGLKASLDRSAGGELAERLAALYDYMSLRLLQANLRNDPGALDEVGRLLGPLAEAWAAIGKAPSR